MIGTLTEGLIYAVMVLGIYISYKILDFPDLSVDGSFVLGGAIMTKLLTAGVPLVLCLILSMAGGIIAGIITGTIHTRFKITGLLSGIIVMIGLYSVNLRIMGRANMNLFGHEHLFNSFNPLVLMGIIVLFTKLALDFFLKTRLGAMIRLVGDNPKFIEGLGQNPNIYKVLGLSISAGLVALCGALVAQYQGYVDISMGTGMLVIGLASIILGESVTKKVSFMKLTSAAIIGSILYRFVITLTLRMGFPPGDLKLITALLLFIILVLNKRKENSNVRDTKLKQKIRQPYRNKASF